MPLKKAKRNVELLDEEARNSPARLRSIRFDRDRYAEARANGLTRRDAMVYARNDSKVALERYAEILEHDPFVQRSIIQKLEEKQHMLLDYIDDEIVAGADLAKLAQAFAVITDRLRLYQGKATAINESRTGLTEEDKERVLSVLRGARVYEAVIKEDAPDDGTAAAPVAGLPAAGGDAEVADGGQGA